MCTEVPSSLLTSVKSERVFSLNRVHSDYFLTLFQACGIDDDGSEIIAEFLKQNNPLYSLTLQVCCCLEPFVK